MGQLTLAITATTTVNGSAQDLSASAAVSVKNFSQQTRDFVDTYEQITDSFNGFLCVCNVGDESLFVQFERAGPTYIPFEVVSGGHVLIPTTTNDGTVTSLTQINMRSASAVGSRAIIITITV